jgi:sphingosine kinase
MASMAGSDDPFRDPLTTNAAPSQPSHASEPTQEQMNVPDTLAVGRNASLTLGTDSLVVLGRETIPTDRCAKLTPHR